MARIPAHVKEIAEAHNIPPEAFWDCHGTWVCKHHALEAAAARANVKWGEPQILEADASKSVAILVSGSIGDYSEWSVGEASPKNNKNAYPWAMAEKRAKDRVILKLLGFSGEVYSEEEADNFKDSAPKAKALPSGSVAPLDANGKSNRDLKALHQSLQHGIEQCLTDDALTEWFAAWEDELKSLPEDYRADLRGKARRLKESFRAKVDA